MSVRLFFSFIKDLFNVLPKRARREWQDLSSLSGDLPTVILISGFAATSRSLSIMRKRLRKDGFNVIVLSLDWQNMSDGFRGLYRLSEKLSSLALRIRKDRNLARTKIYLVAHSAGGLVARYYVQLLGGWHYCDCLITLGTPHSGTWVAGLGFFTHLILKAACLFHMLPISAFIKKINSAPFPEDFPFLSINSKGDYLCTRRSARLPPEYASSSSIETVELVGLSHSELLMSKRTYRVLRQYMKPEGTTETVTASFSPTR